MQSVWCSTASSTQFSDKLNKWNDIFGILHQYILSPCRNILPLAALLHPANPSPVNPGSRPPSLSSKAHRPSSRDHSALPPPAPPLSPTIWLRRPARGPTHDSSRSPSCTPWKPAAPPGPYAPGTYPTEHRLAPPGPHAPNTRPSSLGSTAGHHGSSRPQLLSTWRGRQHIRSKSH
jgi:hypothetical protein